MAQELFVRTTWFFQPGKNWWYLTLDLNTGQYVCIDFESREDEAEAWEALCSVANELEQHGSTEEEFELDLTRSSLGQTLTVTCVSDGLELRDRMAQDERQRGKGMRFGAGPSDCFYRNKSWWWCCAKLRFTLRTLEPFERRDPTSTYFPLLSRTSTVVSKRVLSFAVIGVGVASLFVSAPALPIVGVIGAGCVFVWSLAELCTGALHQLKARDKDLAKWIWYADILIIIGGSTVLVLDVVHLAHLSHTVADGVEEAAVVAVPFGWRVAEAVSHFFGSALETTETVVS